MLLFVWRHGQKGWQHTWLEVLSKQGLNKQLICLRNPQMKILTLSKISLRQSFRSTIFGNVGFADSCCTSSPVGSVSWTTWQSCWILKIPLAWKWADTSHQKLEESHGLWKQMCAYQDGQLLNFVCGLTHCWTGRMESLLNKEAERKKEWEVTGNTFKNWNLLSETTTECI